MAINTSLNMHRFLPNPYLFITAYALHSIILLVYNAISSRPHSYQAALNFSNVDAPSGVL
jgi:hypothetical protein